MKMNRQKLQDDISGSLYKNHGLFVEVFFIAILLIFYFENIFPLLELITEDLEPTMVLTIAGFVWFSLILFVTIFPYWLKSWTFLLIESTYVFALKIHGRIK